ncbi:MAG: hypothetical protein JO051_13820 [Acidobacteriaceae bacterium]|nr:hypothetical protein [Acidobacteriaceae bacterium]
MHTPIRIYYRIDEEERTIEIVHFWHTSRRPPRFSTGTTQAVRVILPSGSSAKRPARGLASKSPAGNKYNLEA